jgi:YesN/AraC family two-component response regulator
MYERDILMELQAGCLKILRSNLRGFCHDSIFDNVIFQCNIIINYPAKGEEELDSILEKTLTEIKKHPNISNTANVTLAVSSPFMEFTAYNQAANEVAEAVWLRFSKGAGKVIYYEKTQYLPDPYAKKLEKYRIILKKACVSLDIEMFTQTLREFCSQPKRVLLSDETRTLIHEIEFYIYNTHENIIAAFSDMSLIHQEISEAIRRSITLEEYLGNYSTRLTTLFKRIIEYAPKNNKYVKQAHYYVDQNIGKPITLTDVAGEFNISPVYFSYLYKQSTGENFMDYVKMQKISAAKIFLEQKKIKINDVAAMTGFSNPKYFARVFKEKEGITPSEYKKIHS